MTEPRLMDPLHRLLRFIEEMDRLDRERPGPEITHYARTQQGRLIERLLGELYELPVDQRYVYSAVLSTWTQVLETVDEARSYVERYTTPLQRPRALTLLDQIEDGLRYSPAHHQWEHVRAVLNTQVLERLTDLAAALETYAEQHVDQQMHQTLLEDLHTLLEDLRSSSLDDTLKDFLIEQVETLIAALLRYRLRGTRAVDEALSVIIGRVARHPDLRASPEAQPWFTRLGGLLAAAAAGYAFNKGADALASTLKVLGGGS